MDAEAHALTADDLKEYNLAPEVRRELIDELTDDGDSVRAGDIILHGYHLSHDCLSRLISIIVDAGDAVTARKVLSETDADWLDSEHRTRLRDIYRA